MVDSKGFVIANGSTLQTEDIWLKGNITLSFNDQGLFSRDTEIVLHARTGDQEENVIKPTIIHGSENALNNSRMTALIKM